MGAPAPRARIESALLKACRLDVVAFKPGNVSLCSPGHEMTAQDFLASARVAVPVLCTPHARVGRRIEDAVRRTRAAVGCNTNLGIVLLLAPLAAAAEQAAGGALRERLAAVLCALDVDDARACYRGIRCAAPAGLGAVEDADVAAEPALDLRRAMALAADYDSVARQYVDDYALVFERGVPLLAAYRARWRSLAWAMTACFVELLASEPDSHVARKHGEGAARALMERAGAVATAVKACENPRTLAPKLRAFDDELKTRGVNPGTTADLSVASAAALSLQERIPFK